MSTPNKPFDAEKLAPPKALVVEDNMLVAETIADGLEVLGYSPVETVSTVKGALDSVADEPIELAVLETDVRGHSTEAVLEALDAKDVAHVIASTESCDALSTEGTYLQKPFSFFQLKNAVAKAARQVSQRISNRKR
ncbi:hypothetical protein [Rhodanobacter sp. BL-MT-08]